VAGVLSVKKRGEIKPKNKGREWKKISDCDMQEGGMEGK
jgi:hypothetical protein